MRTLRIFLLVLLAVLLPVRGAMAAAMACSGGPATPQAHHAADLDHAAPHADHASHGHGTHGDAHAAHHGGAEPAHGQDHAGACQFCASGCCVTPLIMATPTLAGAPPAHGTAFPSPTARIPRVAAEGPERPPRTV